MVNRQHVQPAPEQVVAVWTKGRAFPVFVAALMLLLTAGLVELAVKKGHGAGFRDYGPVIITLAWSTMALTVALRRKVTLTTSRLILRGFFGTRFVPLHEITAIHKTWNRGSRRAGFVADLVSSLITETFFISVKVHWAKNQTASTRAIGRVPDQGMIVIAQAAKRAGNPNVL